MLNLDEVLSNNKPVYVLNTSRPKGKVVIQFMEPSTGFRKAFQVHKTWIPLCVSESIPSEVIRHSMDFRQHLAKGILTLMDPEKAKKTLDDEDAKYEYKRLHRSEFASDTENESDRVKDMMRNLDATGEQQRAAAKFQLDEEQKSQVVTPAVMDLVTRISGDAIKVRDALNEFRCIETELSENDCHYIISNCDGQIRNWAKTKLQHLTATE